MVSFTGQVHKLLFTLGFLCPRNSLSLSCNSLILKRFKSFQRLIPSVCTFPTWIMPCHVLSLALYISLVSKTGTVMDKKKIRYLYLWLLMPPFTIWLHIKKSTNWCWGFNFLFVSHSVFVSLFPRTASLWIMYHGTVEPVSKHCGGQ